MRYFFYIDLMVASLTVRVEFFAAVSSLIFNPNKHLLPAFGPGGTRLLADSPPSSLVLGETDQLPKEA